MATVRLLLLCLLWLTLDSRESAAERVPDAPTPYAERIRLHASLVTSYFHVTLVIDDDGGFQAGTLVEPHDVAVGAAMDADFPFGRYVTLGPTVSVRMNDLADPDTVGPHVHVDMGAAIRVGLPVAAGNVWVHASALAGGTIFIRSHYPGGVPDPDDPHTILYGWWVGTGLGADVALTGWLGFVARAEWRRRAAKWELLKKVVSTIGADELTFELGLTFALP